MVSEEVDKKISSHSPSTSSAHVLDFTLDADGTRDTLQKPKAHSTPLYNATAPSYAPAHIPMPYINHVGDPL